jgi:hypothetical protein
MGWVLAGTNNSSWTSSGRSVCRPGRKGTRWDPILETLCSIFRVNRAKFRETYRREGQYLLRGHLAQRAPATLWEYYTQLTEIEEAFKNLKGDLGIRPLFHQLPDRIEAHIFIAFLTYCLHVTLRRRLRDLAPGSTPRAVLIFPPPTAGPSSFRLTPSPRPIFSSCSNNSNSNYPISRRLKSRPPPTGQ